MQYMVQTRDHSPQKGFDTKTINGLVFFCRIVFGGIFIYASIDKIIDPKGFSGVVENYAILPEMLVNPVALFLPFVELVCGVLLVAGVFSLSAAVVLNGLTVFFILAFIVNLFRGIDVACGCFSNDITTQGTTWWYILRDLIFLAMGIFVLTALWKNTVLDNPESSG